MNQYVKIYMKFIRKYFKAKLEYKIPFLIDIIVNMITPLSFFSIIYIIIGNFNFLESWSLYEVVLMFSFSLISWSLAGFLFWSPFVQIEQLVITGQYDNYLIRPLPPLLFLIFKNFQHTFFGQLIVGNALLVYCLIQIPFDFSILFFIKLIFLLINATLIQSSIMIFLSCTSFYMRKSLTFSMIIVGDLQQMSRYPINIFHNAIQVILTFVLPYAFVSYYPIGVLTHKNVDYVVTGINFIIGPLLLFLSIRFFNFSTKRYVSTGN